MILTETDKAYIAGIIDGEGCIGYYNRGSHKGVPYHSASVHISMTDPRPIKWLKDKVGYGTVSFVTKSGNRRNVYSWQLSNQSELKEFLKTIRPFLLLKGDQVDLLFDLWNVEDTLPKGHGSVTPEVVQYRTDIAAKIKTLKTVSHIVEGVETRRAESSIH